MVVIQNINNLTVNVFLHEISKIRSVEKIVALVTVPTKQEGHLWKIYNIIDKTTLSQSQYQYQYQLKHSAAWLGVGDFSSEVSFVVCTYSFFFT